MTHEVSRLTRLKPWQIHTLWTIGSYAYLIEGPEGLVLVDAGLWRDGALVLRELRRRQRDDLRLIFLTHAHVDHCGGAAAIRRATGAPIAIHRADGDALAQGATPLHAAPRGPGRWLPPILKWAARWWRPPPTSPDLLLRDGDRLDDFDLDAVVLHTPGHTPGSACLWVAGQWLFAGDLVSSTGRPHVQRYLATDWDALAASIRRVRALSPALTYPGHGRKPISSQELQVLHANSSESI